MAPLGVGGNVAGYDPSLLPGRDDRFDKQDQTQTERDTAVTRVADAVGPTSRPDASPVDRSASSPADAAVAAHKVTYGRRALAAPAAAVGLRIDVTG